MLAICCICPARHAWKAPMRWSRSDCLPPPSPSPPALSAESSFAFFLTSSILIPKASIKILRSPPAMPVVDFQREMLIVAAAGRMSPGDRIQIDSVGVREDLYVVVVSTVVECEPFPADAYPVVIVRVPRDERAVAFSEKRTRAAHCT